MARLAVSAPVTDALPKTYDPVGT
ncbi:MAG: hypothetical protein RLZZ459_2131, partial [Cyanobacteriota bacterium]